MAGEKTHSRIVNKRIREIKCSNEILDYGLSELEAVYIRIQTDMVPDDQLPKTKENATILNAKNRCLAHTINKALKEVESTLRRKVQAGIEVDKEIILEFSEVLKESIRILHNYRLIEEAYQDYTKRSYNASLSNQFRTVGHRKSERQKSIKSLQSLIRSLCICGSGTCF